MPADVVPRDSTPPLRAYSILVTKGGRRQPERIGIVDVLGLDVTYVRTEEVTAVCRPCYDSVDS